MATKDTKKLDAPGCTICLSGSFVGIWPISQPAFSLAEWRKETSSISSALNKSDCDVFWYEWIDQPPWRAHVVAMHVQLRTGIPTANGYSGQFPKGNWPYTSPSGLTAFSWISSTNPGLHHRIRSTKAKKNICIVNSSKENQVNIRKLDYRFGVPHDSNISFYAYRGVIV